MAAALAYLMMKGGQVASSLPLSILTDIGSLHRHSPKDAKEQLAREHARIRSWFGREHDILPKKERKKPGFHPLDAYANTARNTIAVSPRAASGILAHELGHIANYAKGQKSLVGKIHQALTSMSYSPLYPASSVVGSMGYSFSDHAGLEGLEDVGHAGVASAGVLGALQLIEEGRASLKARKALKAVKGDHYSAKELAPLLGGFGTYALGATSAVGFPLILHHVLG